MGDNHGNETCIINIISQKKAICSLPNAKHMPSVEQLINLESSCGSDFRINGTFVLKIKNCSVDIEGKKYSFLGQPDFFCEERNPSNTPNRKSVR
jgi:hypothetical protein